MPQVPGSLHNCSPEPVSLSHSCQTQQRRPSSAPPLLATPLHRHLKLRGAHLPPAYTVNSGHPLTLAPLLGQTRIQFLTYWVPSPPLLSCLRKHTITRIGVLLQVHPLMLPCDHSFQRTFHSFPCLPKFATLSPPWPSQLATCFLFHKENKHNKEKTAERAAHLGPHVSVASLSPPPS